MFTGELISRNLAFVDNIDTNTLANRARRRRVLADAQEKYDEVWNHRGWRFSMKNGVITVTAGSRTGILPADFAIIPKFGGVYVDGLPLIDLDNKTMHHVAEGYVTMSHIGYSLIGFSDADQRGQIEFDTPGPLSANIYYKRKPPRLADRPWPGYPILAEGAAGALTGTFRFRATYTTSDGYEHEYGDTTSITVAGKKISITAPDPGPEGEHSVSAINIYRTLNGGSTYYRLHTFTFGDSLVLIDETGDGTLVGQPQLIRQSTLTQIPEEYHMTVLLPGVRAMRKESQGDTRNYQAAYDKGLAEMVREQRPFQSEVQQMPRFGQIY